jgi:putative phosphoribosyl transferase
MQATRFDDRRDAGRRLAAHLLYVAAQRPVVVGLPRGGVPVAAELARELGAPLQTLVVRKLGAPGNRELAVGAIAEDGTVVLDPRIATSSGMTQATLERALSREARELGRRVWRYREARSADEVAGRTVVVVDDGVATGLTELAAVRALRANGASRVVVAIPVGSASAVAMLEDEADQVVCLMTPEPLFGVGAWYRDFSPTTDEEVVELLSEAAERTTPP